MAWCIVDVGCADHSSALPRLFRVMEDSMKELVRNGGGWRQPVAAFYVWATTVLCEASTRTSCGLLEESHAKVIAVHIASNDIEIQTHYSPEEAIPPHHETMNLPLYFVLLVPLGGQEVLETLTEHVVPFDQMIDDEEKEVVAIGRIIALTERRCQITKGSHRRG